MLQSEDGFSDDPRDTGNWLPDGRKGCTNLGVTQRAWEAWLGRVSNEKEMRALTPEIVKPFYKRKYWDAVRGDEIPNGGISYILFDFAVNAGVGRSIKTLQTAIGVPADGGFGPITMMALNKYKPKELIEVFTKEKITFYTGLHNPTYEQGWLNRVGQVRTNALAMV